MNEEDDLYIIILQNNLVYTNNILDALSIQTVDTTDLTLIDKYYDYDGKKILPKPKQQS